MRALARELDAQRVRAVRARGRQGRGQRDRGGDLRGAGPAVHSAGAARGRRRDRGGGDRHAAAADRAAVRRLPPAHDGVGRRAIVAGGDGGRRAVARGYRVLAVTDHAEGTLSGVGREALPGAARARSGRCRRRSATSFKLLARRRAEHRPGRRAGLRPGVPARVRLVPGVGARSLRAGPRGADAADRDRDAGSDRAHDRPPVGAHDRRPAARSISTTTLSSPRPRRPAPRWRSTAACRDWTCPSRRCAARAAAT